MENTGNIKHLHLSDVFKNEAHNFTPWLTHHLDLLSNAVGVEITNPDREHLLTTCFVDIVAQVGDLEDDRVVIENQYGASDHDHLGKLVTYASTVGAKVAIWIVEEARTEHITALETLNRNFFNGCVFFLVKASAMTIDDSLPAILFTPIVKPERAVKTAELSPVNNSLKLFWEAFLAKCKTERFMPFAKERKYLTDYWLDAGIGYGSRCYLSISVKKDAFTIKTVIHYPDTKDTDEVFNGFHEYADEIESIYGERLKWSTEEGVKYRYFGATYSGGYGCEAKELDAIVSMACEKLKKLYEALEKFASLIR